MRFQSLSLRKLISAFVAGVIVFSGSVINSQTAGASETEVSTAYGSMSFQFPDVSFDATGNCITPSFNVEVKSSIPSSDWYVDITIRKSGQTPTGSEGRAYGTNSGVAAGTIQICPSLDGVGAFIVDGVFITYENSTNKSLEKSFVASVNVRKGISTLMLNTLKRSGSNISLAGKVTGNTEKYGIVGLSGSVKVDYQLKNSKKWLALTNTYIGKSGDFKISVVKKLPKNILFRVKFEGNDSMDASEVSKSA